MGGPSPGSAGWGALPTPAWGGTSPEGRWLGLGGSGGHREWVGRKASQGSPGAGQALGAKQLPCWGFPACGARLSPPASTLSGRSAGPGHPRPRLLGRLPGGSSPLQDRPEAPSSGRPRRGNWPGLQVPLPAGTQRLMEAVGWEGLMLRERAGRTPVFSGWEAVRTDQSPGVYEPWGRPPEPSGAMVWGWRWDPKIPSLDGWARVTRRSLLRVHSVCWVFTMLTAARSWGSRPLDSWRN